MLTRLHRKLFYPVVLLGTLMVAACDGTAEAGSHPGSVSNLGLTSGKQSQSRGQAGAGSLPDDSGSTVMQQQVSQSGTLSQGEIDSLVFMREEEKLARDTYLFLNDVWGRNVFSSIADSEQQHTDAVLALLDGYGLNDPAAGNGPGVFNNTTLQDLYDALVAGGVKSLIDALIVGANIEEIDILDIQAALDDVVNNQDIEQVYANLLKGSRNHLRAFVSNLASLGYTYEPDYLTQAVYDEILGSGTETGGLRGGDSGGRQSGGSR